MWTDETLDIARRMKRRGRSFAEISERVGIPESEVAHKVGSTNTKGKNWTRAQRQYLADNLHKTDQQLAQEVSAIGPERTPEAVRTKRRDMKSNPAAPKEEPADGLSWPSMRGTDEERDWRFWRAVVAEALRLRLYRKAA